MGKIKIHFTVIHKIVQAIKKKKKRSKDSRILQMGQ